MQRSTTPPLPLLPASCEPSPPVRLPTQQIWVVFGATGHLGSAICSTALARGDCVTAVGGRNGPPEDEVKGRQALACDVRDRVGVERVWSAAREWWGRVDVVVNCTGYGIIGAVEDQAEDDIRGQFETGVVGAINIFRATLPYFRQRRGGRYLLFSSMHGVVSVPGLGPYCASKWALEGLVESLMFEIDSFGITVTLLEPGVVGEKWGPFVMVPPTEAYRATTSPAQHAMRVVDWVRYRQSTTERERVALIVWELAHCRFPPLRMLLGAHAVEAVRDRVKNCIEEIEDWKFLNEPGATIAARIEEEVGEEVGTIG